MRLGWGLIVSLTWVVTWKTFRRGEKVSECGAAVQESEYLLSQRVNPAAQATIGRASAGLMEEPRTSSLGYLRKLKVAGKLIAAMFSIFLSTFGRIVPTNDDR